MGPAVGPEKLILASIVTSRDLGNFCPKYQWKENYWFIFQQYSCINCDYVFFVHWCSGAQCLPRLQTSRFFSFETSSCPELTFTSTTPIWSLHKTQSPHANVSAKILIKVFLREKSTWRQLMKTHLTKENCLSRLDHLWRVLSSLLYKKTPRVQCTLSVFHVRTGQQNGTNKVDVFKRLVNTSGIFQQIV